MQKIDKVIKVNQRRYTFNRKSFNCPRCGGNLVLREVNEKYKTNNINADTRNNSFEGCTNYPKCKFTRSL